MERKNIYELSETLIEIIQNGASQSDVIQLLEDNFKSVFVVRDNTLFIYGCFNSREKAEKYTNGNPIFYIKEINVA